MPPVKGRTPRRPTRAEAMVLLQGRVPEAVRDVAREAADAAGISIAAYLEALVLADLDGHFVRPEQTSIQEAISA